MAAELVLCGDPAPGVGGEFERECAKVLRDSLPDGYVLSANVNIPRPGGEFYENDLIISAPGICDILEVKCVHPEARVWEDRISTPSGFALDRVLSKLDHKAKVLRSRLDRSPFPSTGTHRPIRVQSQVVVPSNCRVTFEWPQHKITKPVLTVKETVEKYKTLAASSNRFRDDATRAQIRSAWLAFRDQSQREGRRTPQYLGRFAIRRASRSGSGVFEYRATDDPPCRMDVRLREFAFDPLQPAAELQKFLQAVARETRVLMNIRHPNIACVIGHFQTGGSWVQVSDWFDGEKLEELWPTVQEASLVDKLRIFIKVIQALEFCHERGVFHRNISAETIQVARDLSDVRVVGFDCALDVLSTATTNTDGLRDIRVLAPEELQGGGSTNPRLSDIFQTGVVLYRLLEDGAWPFTDTLDYVTSSGQLRPFAGKSVDREILVLQQITADMLAIDPRRRTDLLGKVERQIAELLG